MAARFDSLHAQLGWLLENAQSLLADSAPPSTTGGGNPYYAGGSGRGAHGSTIGQAPPPVYSFVAMQSEIRTLEFWRSIIAECMATFVYVMIVLSVSTTSSEHTQQTNCALASGLAMAMLVAVFARVSGSHTNPAITLGMTLTRYISPLRSVLYMCAQCGGGIAGAALTLGVHGRINDPALKSERGTFGMEFVLSFLVVYTYFAAKETRVSSSYRTRTLVPGHIRINPIFVGVAHAACLVAWKGSLNPARALGSAFVSRSPDRFDQHWVFWVGPLLGAITGAFAFEYIFNPRRKAFTFSSLRGPHDLENVSIRSEDDMIDDLERAKQYRANIMQDFQDPTHPSSARGGHYGKRLGAAGGMNHINATDSVYGGSKSVYNQSIYDSKSMYDGTKSMYDGYDGMDRNAANLRRSRSIHTKFPPPNHSVTRRNPYDYLPDEPSKADMMQTESGPRLMGKSGSPRYLDSYGNEKMDLYGETGGYGALRGGPMGKGGLLATTSDMRPMDDSYDSNYSSSGVKRSSALQSGLSASDYHHRQQQEVNHLNRERDFPPSRAGGVGGGSASGPGHTRLRGTTDYYPSPSQQYNATYSQQNGCSITNNPVPNYHHSPSGAVTAVGTSVPPAPVGTGANY